MTVHTQDKKERKEFDLESYLASGVENIVKGALRATLKDPRESAFMAGFARQSRKAAAVRAGLAAEGEHIPPFLIASITESCNLHCTGCYARANHACGDVPAEGTSCGGGCGEQLTADQWGRIFAEARSLGVSFILLAGGEPFLRKDVLQEAARVPEILFPVFTNGTLLDESLLKLFAQHRNLVPVFSIEGDRAATDSRRGDGTYQRLRGAMAEIREEGLIFAASVTVTTENREAVMEEGFLKSLEADGCRAVIFVEYVPVTEESRHLAFGEEERVLFDEGLQEIRQKHPEMVFIAFPGDEKSSGGCLAAGRGFFHINARGGAEPCPFSPYSDINVAQTSLREGLHSRFFARLHQMEVLTEEHTGGCVLFEKREQVEALLAEGQEPAAV